MINENDDELEDELKIAAKRVNTLHEEYSLKYINIEPLTDKDVKPHPMKEMAELQAEIDAAEKVYDELRKRRLDS